MLAAKRPNGGGEEGAVPAAVAVWALLNPPQGWPHESLFLYLMGRRTAENLSTTRSPLMGYIGTALDAVALEKRLKTAG